MKLTNTVPIKTLGRSSKFSVIHTILLQNRYFRHFDSKSGPNTCVSVADLVDMPIALPQNKLRGVEAQLQLGIAHDDIARRTGVSKRSIRRIKHNLKKYSSTNPPQAENQGGPRKMTAEMEEVP